MTVSYSGLPIAIGLGVGMVLADAMGLSFEAGMAVGAVIGVLGAVAWVYSPLPDSNGGMAASKFRGEYWGFSPPTHMTTEEFVCRECGHGPMLFDTRADDLHIRFEENEKDWLGRRIKWVGRCEECNKKIGWLDKKNRSAPDPPDGYQEPYQLS